jgi:Protein of unknown function (DUF2637)
VILRIARAVALWGITVLVAASTLVAFGESYRALYLWAVRHNLPGLWAYFWPLQVDTFLAVGELALVVAMTDRWSPRSRAAAWAVTGIGLGVSVAGNVGHVAGHSVTSRATAAIPPLAAAAALAVGLGVLKRVTAATGSDSGATLALSGSDRVRGILKASPALPKADVAEMAGVSARTVERVKRELNGASKVNGNAGSMT